MKTLFACFSQNLDYALGWMVIHSLWQAIAIALIMGIVMIVLRKQPAKVRYWVANASLLLVLISAMATFIHYYDFTKGASAMRFIPEGTPSVFLNETVNPTVESPPLGDLGGLSLTAFKSYFNEHIPLIVMIWAMGVALFILKLLGGISYCYYLRSRLNFPADEYWIETLDALKQKVGVKQSIELVESALTRTPMVVGIMKPMILFPIGAINRLSPTEVEAILAHEIAHVLRKDYIFNIIQSVIEALFYFHPAVWWISSIIRNERENCCDDVAIEICGSSMNYAKALVTVQEMAYYPMYQPALAFAGNRKNQLLFRVQRILNQPQNKTNVMEKLIATCLLVVMMVGLSFGDNNINNKNNLLSENNSINTEGVTNFIENPTESGKPTQATSLFLKYKVNGELDSFPLQKETKNGTYNYEDNTQKVTLTVLDNMVTSFNINDVEMAKSDISKFEKLINKIITSDSKQYINSNETSQEGALATVSSADNKGFYLDSDKAKMSADANGLHLNAVDDNGQSFNLSVDQNGFNMDGVDENGQPINMNIDKNGVNLNNKEELQNDVVELRQEMKELRQEIKECGCTTNFDFRMSLIGKIDGLLSNFNSSANQQSYNNTEMKFLKIKNEWESGECDDNNNSDKGSKGSKGSKSNSNGGTTSINGYGNNSTVADISPNYYSYGTGSSKADAERARINAVNAQKNAERTRINAVNAQKNAERTRINAVNAQKNAERARKNNGQANKDSETSRRDSEIARRDSEIARQDELHQMRNAQNQANDDKKDKAIRGLFKNLINGGYISLNKKCQVEFDNKRLKVEGKTLDNATFTRIKKAFEAQLGKKSNYAIAFNGYVKSISESDLEMEGSFTTSVSNED